jgi:putative hydroxymethylpyrimidine transport system substrate-binding protein
VTAPRARVAATAGAAAIAVAIVLLLALGGGSTSGGRQRVSLLLDFFPNADHAGIYAAQADGIFKAHGLDVRIHAPSDPSVPLKLLAAGRTDLAISYEPEVLRARDKGAPVVAVAALVRVPLTSIVSLPSAHVTRPADLAGKTVGTAGIDYQTAYLNAVTLFAGVPRNRVSERNVGFDLVPALVTGKVDAVLGAYWNYEAVQLRQKGQSPRVIRIEQAGVPSYDELVVAANESTVRRHPDRIRRFLAALGDGTRRLAAAPVRQTDRGLLKLNRGLDAKLQRASVSVTLPYFLPKPGQPFGHMDPAEWDSFTAFMHRYGLLKVSKPAGAFTNALLPAGQG